MVDQKNIKSDFVNICMLCNKCRLICPLSIDIKEAVIRIREHNVDLGIETEQNKKMIANIKKSGNIYGL